MQDDAVEFFEVLPWNTNFETGIAVIDEQHKQLVRLLNLLAAHLAHQSAPVKLNQVFDELAAYADFHFKTEEAIWQPYFKEDSRFLSHQHAHNFFITNVLKLKEEKHSKSLDEVTVNVLKFLTHWLVYHILDTDKRMAKTILAVDSGLTLEQAMQYADHEISGSMKFLIDAVLNMYDALSSRTLDLMRKKAECKRSEIALKKAHDELGQRVAERTVELKKVEKRFRLMIQAAPLPMAVNVNNNGQKITLLNDKFVKMFGYTMADIPTMKAWWSRAYPNPDDRACAIREWKEQTEKVQQRGGEFGPLENRVCCKDGRVRDILFSMARIDKNSSLVIFHDLSERNKMEKALVNSQEQFHQAQKMEAVGTLVGGIAHDFNNTLAGIVGNLYLAKKAAKSLPDVIHRLETVEKLSFGAAATIQQLLAFSRKGIVEMQPLSVASFLKETIKLQQIGIPEDISLSTEIHDEKMHVNGDINQLQQVLINLINNASDAVTNAQDPTINIVLNHFHADKHFMAYHETLQGLDFACLTVSDNGLGIKDEHLEHIFEPFFTTKEFGKGTGLGLAMSYGAIKTHGGAITVKSKQGGDDHGTSISIYLPLLEEPQTITLETKEDAIIEGNGETILLVDDNEAVLHTGREVLEGLGYQIITACDGENAVELYKAHQHEIDLVILDVVMPKLSGPDALQIIKTINPNVKAIFATGYDKSSVSQSKAIKAKELIISKPFAINKLSKAILMALT